MRCKSVLVLPLLLALSQLVVSSGDSTPAAQQRQEQQPQSCWQPDPTSYASTLHAVLGSGSCPAPLYPSAAEAPVPAAVATASAAPNSTQDRKAQRMHSSSGSRDLSSDRQDAQQQCRGKGDCSWQTFIVRFSQYKVLSEHKAALGKVRAHPSPVRLDMCIGQQMFYARKGSSLMFEAGMQPKRMQQHVEGWWMRETSVLFWSQLCCLSSL